MTEIKRKLGCYRFSIWSCCNLNLQRIVSSILIITFLGSIFSQALASDAFLSNSTANANETNKSTNKNKPTEIEAKAGTINKQQQLNNHDAPSPLSTDLKTNKREATQPLSVQVASDENLLFTSTNKYQPYLEVGGAKYFNQNTKVAGIYDLFIPLMQNDDQLLFTDLRIFDRSGSSFEGNLHLGYRKLWLDRSQLFGVYGAFDYKKSNLGNDFGQLTVGIEYWRNQWFIGGNAYMPIGKTQKFIGDMIKREYEVVGKDITEVVTSSKFYEKALPGVDGELGLAITDNLVGYIGGYHFVAKDTKAVIGPKIRVAYDYKKSVGRIFGVLDAISIEAGATHDKPRGTVAYIGVRLKIGLANLEKNSNLTGFERHMVELVRRDPDIVIGEAEKVEPKKIELSNQQGYMYTPQYQNENGEEDAGDANKSRPENDGENQESNRSQANIRGNEFASWTTSRLLEEFGLVKGATYKEIHKRYHQFALKHHPDRGGKQENFIRVNNIFEVLKYRLEPTVNEERSKYFNKPSAAFRSAQSPTFQNTTQDTTDKLQIARYDRTVPNIILEESLAKKASDVKKGIVTHSAQFKILPSPKAPVEITGANRFFDFTHGMSSGLAQGGKPRFSPLVIPHRFITQQATWDKFNFKNNTAKEIVIPYANSSTVVVIKTRPPEIAKQIRPDNCPNNAVPYLVKKPPQLQNARKQNEKNISLVFGGEKHIIKPMANYGFWQWPGWAISKMWHGARWIYKRPKLVIGMVFTTIAGGLVKFLFDKKGRIVRKGSKNIDGQFFDGGDGGNSPPPDDDHFIRRRPTGRTGWRDLLSKVPMLFEVASGGMTFPIFIPKRDLNEELKKLALEPLVSKESITDVPVHSLASDHLKENDNRNIEKPPIERRSMSSIESDQTNTSRTNIMHQAELATQKLKQILSLDRTDHFNIEPINFVPLITLQDWNYVNKRNNFSTSIGNIGSNNANIDAVNLGYEYEDQDMNALILLRAQEAGLNLGTTVIMAPISATGSQLLRHLMEERFRYQREISNGRVPFNRTALVILNLYNLHWVGLIIRFNAANHVEVAQYVDPLGQIMPTHVGAVLRNIYGRDIVIQNLRGLGQTDGMACGPLAIENIVQVAQNRLSMHNVEEREIREIRRHHLELLERFAPELQFGFRQRRGVRTFEYRSSDGSKLIGGFFDGLLPRFSDTFWWSNPAFKMAVCGGMKSPSSDERGILEELSECNETGSINGGDGCGETTTKIKKKITCCNCLCQVFNYIFNVLDRRLVWEGVWEITNTVKSLLNFFVLYDVDEKTIAASGLITNFMAFRDWCISINTGISTFAGDVKKENPGQIGEILRDGLVEGCILGMLLVPVYTLFPLMLFLDQDHDIAKKTQDYLAWYSIGLPFEMMTSCFNELASTLMGCSIWARNLINIARRWLEFGLGYTLVRSGLGIGGMGLANSIASFASFVASASFFYGWMAREKYDMWKNLIWWKKLKTCSKKEKSHDLELKKEDIATKKIDNAKQYHLKNLLLKGLSNAVVFWLDVFPRFISTLQAGAAGNIALVVYRITSFCLSIQGVVVGIISNAYMNDLNVAAGASKYVEARTFGYSAMKFALGSVLVLSLIFGLRGESIASSIFLSDIDTALNTQYLFWFMIPTMFTDALSNVCASCLAGLKNSLYEVLAKGTAFLLSAGVAAITYPVLCVVPHFFLSSFVAHLPITIYSATSGLLLFIGWWQYSNKVVKEGKNETLDLSEILVKVWKKMKDIFKAIFYCCCKRDTN